MSVVAHSLSRFTRVWRRRRRHGRRPSRERRRATFGIFFAFGGRTTDAACARMRAFSQKPKRDVASSNVGDGSFSFLRNLFDGRLTLFIAAIGRTVLVEAGIMLWEHSSNILEISCLVISVCYLAKHLNLSTRYKAH